MKSIVKIQYKFLPYDNKLPTVAISKITKESEDFYSCDSSLFSKGYMGNVMQIDKDIYACCYVSQYEEPKDICNEDKFKETMDKIKEYIINQYNNMFKQISIYEEAYQDYIKK